MKLWFVSLIVTVILFLLEAYYLMGGIYDALERTSPLSIFWLDVYSVPLRLALTCLVIPSSTIAVIFIFPRYKQLKTGHATVMVFLLIFTGAVGFCALLSGIFRRTTYQTGLSFEDHQYQVALSYADIGLADDYPELILYECGKWGIVCNRVFSYQQSHSKPTISWLGADSWKSSLVPDSPTKTVTLLINGETVYEHEVK